MAFVNRQRISPNSERWDNDAVPGQHKIAFYAKNRWVLDGIQYRAWKKAVVGQDLEIETANFKVRSNKATASFDFGPVNKRVLVERKQGQAWLEEGLPLIDYSIVSENADNATYEWNFGALIVRLEVIEGSGKWTYIYTATENRTYRIKIVNRCPLAETFRTRANKAGSLYQAEWRLGARNYRYNWRDMLPVTSEINGNEVVLLSPEQALTVGQQIILDPSFSDDADWGADVYDAGSSFPNDGSDYCGDDGTNIYRVGNKFTITTLPTDATVNQVDFAIYVDVVTGASGSTWILGPYNGDGYATDMETDSAVNMYARCDVSADNYLTGITDYRTTGQKTHTNLGAAANADVEAARDSGTIYQIAIRMTTEGSSTDRADFREYSHGTTPPQLTITYTAAGAGSILPMVMQNTNQFNGGLNA